MDTNRGKREHEKPEWSGFAEVDRAIAENRLTEYRWKKAWADSWARIVIITAAIFLAGFIAFVIVQDLIL